MRTSRREFVKGTAVLAASAFGWASLDAGEAAEASPGSANDGLAGDGVNGESDWGLDLAPFGYQFRSQGSAELKAPETRWLTEGRPDVLAGVMWEEHRPVCRVEVDFSAAAADPRAFILEITTHTPTAKQDNRPTWWTRQFEVFPGNATVSADGRRMVYATDQATIAQRLKQYPKEFQYEPDPRGLMLVDRIRLRYLGEGPRPAVTGFRAFGLAKVTPLRLEIEWGFMPGRKEVAFDGQMAIYNGRLGKVRPLENAQGVIMTGPSQWRSAPAPTGRAGVEVEVWYVADDHQEVRFRPSVDLPTGSNGSLTYHPNLTAVTVQTSKGAFTFAPQDLQSGEPILVPSLGFFVAPAGRGLTAGTWYQQWQKRTQLTVRQRVRQRPEQSLTRVLDDHYTARRPTYPQPEGEPPMRIAVPDELASAAWRLAFWHVKRRCIKQDDTYLFYIWPYQALLGQESWRLFLALDLLGEHAMTRSGFGPWFRSQGRFVARGMFTDKAGALNVDGWDLNHAQGHGSMLYAMAEHYWLSGDRAWLAEHVGNLKAACEWVLRQRREWSRNAGGNTWMSGLISPCEMGDYADWRSLYQTNVFFWRGLKQAAEAIAVIEPEAGSRYRQEAEELREAIVKAAERSISLAPVMRVKDGSYRRYIPPQPYLRGLCDRITNPFGGAHAGSLVMDSDLGAASLGLGVLPGDDPRLDELLDVLEDDLYLDNWMVRRHTEARKPGRPDSWFSIGGYYYQCGYSQSALAHLFRDDVPNYLRSMFNQYAADVDPEKAYQFREHPNRTGEGNGGDKTFEVAAFLERMRAMFVMEEGTRLWLARGTPRSWLEEGKRISVENAPSHFGNVAYGIKSEVDSGRITATVGMPSRGVGSAIWLRLRHPKQAPLRSVEVNGQPWTGFDPSKEVIRLDGLQGTLAITARY
jgi:hypothetical protein